MIKNNNRSKNRKLGQRLEIRVVPVWEDKGTKVKMTWAVMALNNV